MDCFENVRYAKAAIFFIYTSLLYYFKIVYKIFKIALKDF